MRVGPVPLPGGSAEGASMSRMKQRRLPEDLHKAVMWRGSVDHAIVLDARDFVEP